MRIEDQMMRTIFEFARMHEQLYPALKMLHHIPNEGRRKPWVAKRHGIKSGVPDMCLPVSNHGYHGLYLELKSPNKKPTEKQNEWLKQLDKNGYYANWTDSVEEACDMLLWYVK